MLRLLPILLLLLSAHAAAQDAPADTAQAPVPLADSLGGRLQGRDTLGLGARPPAAPGGAPASYGVPVAPAADGGLEAPVTFAARDSLRIVFAPRRAPRDSAESPDGDVLSLYGEAEATYEDATITAALLQYKASAEVLRAEPAASDTGAVGVPQFARGQEAFSGERFEYNLATRRGRVLRARTQVQEGYLLGGILKQQDEHVVFGQDVAYTTCDLDHPHYALEAGRVKVVDGEEVFTGPIQLKLLGVPMPVILPFGYIPTAEGRRSGPLAVGYGQESGFGLFLENLGWYWAISDYLDAQVAGKVGTQGSFQVTALTNYRKRYAYDGALSVSVGRLTSGERTDPTYAPVIPFGVNWRHNQTFPAGQRLTGSVNFQSRSQRLVSTNLGDELQQSTSSTVSYNQSWNSVGRSLSASLR